MTKIKVVTNSISFVTKLYFVTNIIYNSDKKGSCHCNFIISVEKNIYHKRLVTNIYIFYFHILKLSLMHILVK